MESVCINDIVCRTTGGRVACCDASARFLVVGTSAGAVWWFDRSSGEVTSFSPCGELVAGRKQQSVLAVRISNDEQLVAVGDAAEVLVVALSGGKRVLSKNRAGGPAVTCLEFASDSRSIMHGYEDGSVVWSRGEEDTLLVKPCGEAVVQLSASPRHLLVSSLVRSSLVNLDSLAVVAVGKQSVRNGLFGATYHPLLPGFFVASRPALRLWLAEDGTGSVVRTLPFVASAPGDVLGRMLVFGSNLVSVSDSCLLFLDLESVKITQSFSDWPTGIRQAAVSGDTCYVCCGNSSLFAVSKPRKVLLKKMSSMLSSVLQQPLISQPLLSPALPPIAAQQQQKETAQIALTTSQQAATTPPPPPAVVFDMRFVAVANRVCALCNDAWRGISLDGFSVSEADLALLRSAFAEKSPKSSSLFAAMLCIHALLGTWPLPEVEVSEFVRLFKGEIARNDRALEALVAALAFANNQTLLEEFSSPDSPLLYFRLRSGAVVDNAAMLSAQKWPALSDSFFFSCVSSRQTRLEYLVHLLDYYPLLATVPRMELLLSLCEPLANGVWPLDDLMLSFCCRCPKGELLPVCRSIRYHRGILEVDYESDLFGEQFALVVAIGNTALAASLLRRRTSDSASWAAAFRLSSDRKSAVNCAFVAQQAVQFVRPASLLSQVLAGCCESLPHLAPVVAALALREHIRSEAACSLLETIDAHLWAKQNPHVLPQAVATSSPAVEASRLAKALSWQHDAPASLSFDEMQTHWGTKSSGVCVVCLVAAGPVRVFRCGHAAHAECSPEEACAVCFNASFTSLRLI